VDILERNWWAIGLRGLIAVVFGLIALARPDIGLIVLLAFLGAWWLVDGIFSIIAAVYAAENRLRWWPLLVEGITGIVLGAAIYFYPGPTTLVLLLFVAAWAIVTGSFRIVAAVRLRREVENEWLLILSGVISLVLGVLVWLFPQRALPALVITIGIFALILGIAQIMFSVRLYGIHRWHIAHPA
jgi:uncharacterized membrane protein HdeD (DUF308 family)